MIKVDLIAKTDISPQELSSHAAKVCYASNVPELGSLIDVENRLFATGHHTTLQHNYFTFCLDNISISAVTFGLHMTTPFYNTDQRSGRFSKMFDNPNFEELKDYLEHFYPEDNIDKAIEFISKGCEIYKNNIDKLTELAKENIKKERPFANEKYIEANAPKFAQEQLRSFISQATPTALDYTINISALAALYRVAWSPELREVTEKMVKEIIKLYPDVAYMFDENKRINKNWAVDVKGKKAGVLFEPRIELLETNIAPDYELWDEAKDSVDLLQVSPFASENFINNIKTKVEMSAVSMGQDQRHRTIKRGTRNLTGNFYVTPLMRQTGLEELAKNYMNEFILLGDVLSPELLTAITPYGAMFEYNKISELNGLMHEQGKRSCWCAQEELYHITISLREELSNKGGYEKLCEKLCPPCYENGKCSEGVRYCGRNMKIDKNEYFPKRVI